MLLTILLLISVYQSEVCHHLWALSKTCSLSPWGQNPFILILDVICLFHWADACFDGTKLMVSKTVGTAQVHGGHSISHCHKPTTQGAGGKPASPPWWSSINYLTKSRFSYTWHCTVLSDEMGVACQTLSCTERERKMLVSRKRQQVERGELNWSIFSGSTVFFKRLKTMVTYTWIFGRKFSQNEKESLKLGKTADRICCQG